jgi:DNA-binding CsgD family transcriptional regulator
MKNAFQVSGSSPTLADVATGPSCKKKYFESEEQAKAFEICNREKHKRAEQYAYKCEECDGYHLSALPPGTTTMARTNYPRFENSAVRRPAGRGKRLSDETIQEIKKLHAGHVSAGEISRKLGISVPSVYNHTRLSNRRQPSVLSLEGIGRKQQDLEAQIQALEAEKRRLLEAKEFKFTHSDTGFLRVEKEGNCMALSVADWKELTERLMEELFPKPGSLAPYAVDEVPQL